MIPSDLKQGDPIEALNNGEWVQATFICQTQHSRPEHKYVVSDFEKELLYASEIRNIKTRDQLTSGQGFIIVRTYPKETDREVTLQIETLAPLNDVFFEQLLDLISKHQTDKT